MLNMKSLAEASFILLGLAAQARADCTRDQLQSIADSYIAAQTAGNPSLLPVADSIAVYQNQKTITLAGSQLATALKIDHNRTSLDTTQCATYTELIVTGSANPRVIGTQLRLGGTNNASVARIDSIVTKPGDWLFNVTGTLHYASQEAWTTIATAQENTRAVIQAAADAYLDLFNNKSVVVPWGSPCARLEGGSYVTPSCNVGVPSGLQLINRRYVIDELYGAVDVQLTFGGSTGLPDSHEFRIEGGKIRFVHTMSVQT